MAEPTAWDHAFHALRMFRTCPQEDKVYWSEQLGYWLMQGGITLDKLCQSVMVADRIRRERACLLGQQLASVITGELSATQTTVWDANN